MSELVLASDVILDAIEALEEHNRIVPELDVNVDHLIKEVTEVASYIKKSPGKSQWCVYSEKGKRMGCYPSQAQARKRLRQIEYFKHTKAESNAGLILLAAYIRRRKNLEAVYESVRGVM